MAKRKYIYYGSLERFGYNLTVIDTTEQGCRDALKEKYIKTYKEINGTDPAEDIWCDNTSYYDLAMEEMYVDKFELGKVEWL